MTSNSIFDVTMHYGDEHRGPILLQEGSVVVSDG